MPHMCGRPAQDLPAMDEKAIDFPTGSDFTIDEVTGLTKSKDGTWLYNPSTYIFYHNPTGGYYSYDKNANGGKGAYVQFEPAAAHAPPSASDEQVEALQAQVQALEAELRRNPLPGNPQWEAQGAQVKEMRRALEKWERDRRRRVERSRVDEGRATRSPRREKRRERQSRSHSRGRRTRSRSRDRVGRRRRCRHSRSRSRGQEQSRSSERCRRSSRSRERRSRHGGRHSCSRSRSRSRGRHGAA
eukprot:SAG11_NODE_1557_length_4684_cov_3.766194_1_plen_244_part_00